MNKNGNKTTFLSLFRYVLSDNMQKLPPELCEAIYHFGAGSDGFPSAEDLRRISKTWFTALDYVCCKTLYIAGEFL